ncbi:MAG: hypothetical protein WC679_00005, partial [Bacteroidales bacterium]
MFPTFLIGLFFIAIFLILDNELCAELVALFVNLLNFDNEFWAKETGLLTVDLAKLLLVLVKLLNPFGTFLVFLKKSFAPLRISKILPDELLSESLLSQEKSV